MKFRTLAVCLLIPTGTFAMACGGSADANKANMDMSAPSHQNMSPNADGGVVDNATQDVSKPATVNESPAPSGSH